MVPQGVRAAGPVEVVNSAALMVPSPVSTGFDETIKTTSVPRRRRGSSEYTRNLSPRQLGQTKGIWLIASLLKRKKPNVSWDVIGVPCARSGTPLTKDGVKEQARNIAGDVVKNPFKKTRLYCWH